MPPTQLRVLLVLSFPAIFVSVSEGYRKRDGIRKSAVIELREVLAFSAFTFA